MVIFWEIRDCWQNNIIQCTQYNSIRPPLRFCLNHFFSFLNTALNFRRNSYMPFLHVLSKFNPHRCVFLGFYGLLRRGCQRVSIPFYYWENSILQSRISWKMATLIFLRNHIKFFKFFCNFAISNFRAYLWY